MKFVVTEAERKASGSTCYFEFQHGKYRRKHWQKESVFLHADVFDEAELYRLFADALPDFNYYGPTEVSEKQWAVIVENAAANERWMEIISELTPWVEACFQKYRCFTLCGI